MSVRRSPPELIPVGQSGSRREDFETYLVRRDVQSFDSQGTSNTHPGQGTANRRFFFHNAMLELLWVHDTQEAKSELIRPTRLWERWTNRKDNTCPFGVGLRPGTSGSDTVAFSSWAYRPPYLSDTLSIAVGTNSNVLTEPMLFQIPFGKRPDQYSTRANYYRSIG